MNVEFLVDKGDERKREREIRNARWRINQVEKEKKKERSIDNQLPPLSSCNQSSEEQKVTTTGWKIFRLSRIQVETEHDEKNRSIEPIAGCSPIIRFLRWSNNSVIIFIDTVRERKRHVLEEMAGYSNIECLQWNFLF